MATPTKERLKRAALLGFVVASILLVGMIWADGLITDAEPATPGYYRDSFDVDESIYLTVTAEALEYQQQLTGTPQPDGQEHHHGQEQGADGHGRGSEKGQNDS